MTDKSLNILAGYKRAIESMVVVSVGTLMHLNSISIIELRHSKLPLLMPNAASTLFAFSILCIFANLRPLWTRPLRNPQQIFSFLMEMTLILYGTDFLVRQLWVPSLKVLSFVCNLLAHYTVKVNNKFLTHQAPFIDDWMRTEAFYLVRFIWALVVFIFMLDTTGVFDMLLENLRKKIKWCISDDIYFDDNLSVEETPLIENLSKDDISSQSSDGEDAGTNSVPFDFNELQCVAQEDLASSTHAAPGVRRRRKMSRKTKRNNKVSLNNTVKECFC